MVLRAGLVALLCAVLPARLAGAQADDQAAAREVAEGEKLAKAGLFAESVARFKAAESLSPHAAHDCYIALSYLRARKLGQAELFMQRCAARATGSDPAPSWLVSMTSDLKKAIAAADLPEVAIRVLPDAAADSAKVTCSAFAPDETFAPATIRLPPGQHTLRVEADGFTAVEKPITVVTHQPLAVEITLEPVPAAPVAEPPPATPPRRPAAVPAAAVTAEAAPPPEGRGPWPYVVLGVAGAALAGGVALHVKALHTKDDAESSLARYNELANDYESQRNFTYTLYTVAVISGAIGAWMWFHGAPDDGAGGFQASAAAAPDGAFVTFGWSP
jgi:hypothetical protein